MGIAKAKNKEDQKEKIVACLNIFQYINWKHTYSIMTTDNQPEDEANQYWESLVPEIMAGPWRAAKSTKFGKYETGVVDLFDGTRVFRRGTSLLVSKYAGSEPEEIGLDTVGIPLHRGRDGLKYLLESQFGSDITDDEYDSLFAIIPRPNILVKIKLFVKYLFKRKDLVVVDMLGLSNWKSFSTTTSHQHKGIVVSSKQHLRELLYSGTIEPGDSVKNID